MKKKGKARNKKEILLIFCAAAFLILLVTGVYLDLSGHTYSKDVDCYDNHNNKIDGLICEGQDGDIYYMIWATSLGIVSVLSILLLGMWMIDVSRE